MASETLKDRLVARMADTGTSQAQVAAHLKVSPQAVSAWCSGLKRPTDDNLAELADLLGVSQGYLRFGDGAEAPQDLTAPQRDRERADYSEVLTWWFRPGNPDGGRELGNAAGFAFDVDPAITGREAAQNTVDEKLPGEAQVTMRITVNELSGETLRRYLKVLRFDDQLRPHLEAAATREKQKSAAVIKAGLKLLDESKKLVLVKIEDFSATGLVGEEYDDGNYMAVVRNVLDSFKGETAGGSYGLGKAAMSAASRFGLVLINSNLSKAVEGQKDRRFVGRIELPWHRISDGQTLAGEFAGPGWFGVKDQAPRRQGATRSWWANRTLTTDLFMERTDEPGTSFVIVGAYDPSGGAETVEQLIGAFTVALADNFWAAMTDRPDGTPASLKAWVCGQRNGVTFTEQLVDPRLRQPTKVDAFLAHLEDAVVPALESPGDVVRDTVKLVVPKRVVPDTHNETEHEALLLVVYVDDLSRGPGEQQLNRVAFMRGSHMVISEDAVPSLPVGARPFFAIVLAGEAAGSEASDKIAERFLRAAEPPAHDRWVPTPDVVDSYARGARQRILDFHAEIRKKIRAVVSKPSKDVSDGPDALKELLRLTIKTPLEPRPRVKAARRLGIVDGAWSIEATVSLPPKEEPWRFAPVIRFATESGTPIPVNWKEITALAQCREENGFILANLGARTVRFSGVTDPATHPVGATRARVQVDVRSVKEGTE